MKNFDEYVHFVVGAKIAKCEIECADYKYQLKFYYKIDRETSIWNWNFFFYRIKLPEGWEYIIEDGDIAFREPNNIEWFIEYDGVKKAVHMKEKRPIIKRTGKEK